MPPDKKSSRFKRFGATTILIWTIIIGTLLAIQINDHHTDTIKEATNEARDYFRLNLFYRAWASKMGGVYVPADKAAPNPYLQVPNRDITTSYNRQLTLVNPAYMTRMVFEDIKAASPDPIISKLTSLKPLNPANAPDEWERQSLTAFDNKQYTERSEVTEISGKPYLRFISAFTTSESCLNCHAHQGYKVGDVRGAIVISVPLSKQYAEKRQTDLKVTGAYGFLWIIGCIGIAFSSNRRFRDAESLLREQSRSQTYLESVETMVIVLDTEGRITTANRKACQILGYREDELLGKSWFITCLPQPEGKETIYPYFLKMIAGDFGAVECHENTVITKNGELRLIVWHNGLLYDDKEKIIGIISAGDDFTERKQTEDELLESKTLIEAVIENVPLMIFLKEATDLRFVLFNRAGEELVGYDRESFLGKNNLDLFPPEQAANFMAKDREVLNIECGFVDIPEEPIMTAKKGLRLLHTRKVCIRGGDGVTKYVLGISEDITDLKKAAEEKQALEQQFQQTQKLESLGVLAGGIAHDFNNILAIIMGYCSLTKMDYEDAEKNIPEIEKAVERAAALCRQMLAYAGKASLTQTQVNTWMLVDEMVTMLKTTIQQNVVIKPELGTDIPFIMGDASQIRQVVMNLIINAAEAIGAAEGEIDVKLTKTEIKTEQSEKDHLGIIIPTGRYILFEVSDNGCGMDDETRRKIFEPFYTTKFTGRGLGMSAVLGIIKAHNGALQLESRLGHGTTFRVYLLVQISKNETDEAQQIKASAPWQGSGTILLVEDEVQVRTIAIILLKEIGFKVIDAANGREALELYQQNAADITLVITDMGMPVMNGYELFYKLKQLDPQLPIIISSGFGEGDIASKIPREEIAGMIDKPYNFEHLREVLRKVVEGTA